MSTNPLDHLTRELTAFESFQSMLDTPPTYRPTILPRDERHVALANAYDAAQLARGDPRRTYRGLNHAPANLSLPVYQWMHLLSFLEQYHDEIAEGGWEGVEAVEGAIRHMLQPGGQS